jgi:hypothetical protein
MIGCGSEAVSFKAVSGRQHRRPSHYGCETGTVGKTFNVLDLWREEVENVTGYALPCGHLIPEEALGPLLQALDKYLVA